MRAEEAATHPGSTWVRSAWRHNLNRTACFARHGAISPPHAPAATHSQPEALPAETVEELTRGVGRIVKGAEPPPKGGTRFRELFGTPLAGPTVRDVYARQLIVPAAR